MAAETANPPGMLPSQGVQRPDRRCIVLFVNMPRTQNLNVSMPSLPLVHEGHRRTIKKMLSPLAALVSCKRNESCLRLLYHTKSGEAMLFSAAPGGEGGPEVPVQHPFRPLAAEILWARPRGYRRPNHSYGPSARGFDMGQRRYSTLLQLLGKANHPVGFAKSHTKVKTQAVVVVQLAVAGKFPTPLQSRPSLALEQQTLR